MPTTPASGRLPKVKICGVTSRAEALLAADLGADFVGLNFHPPSPRYLDPERAAEIAAAVRGLVKTVGVFVNRPRWHVEAVADAVGLDLLQFHGDETPADVEPFARRALVARRVSERIDAAAFAGFEGVWGVLIDARHPQLYGGTGTTWRFESLRELEPGSRRRAFIAGGLRPDNVRTAIAAADPYGVDLCSGLEARPGKKDPELMKQLFDELGMDWNPPAA